MVSTSGQLSDHWSPYWKLCAPCNRDTTPQAVVELEDMAEEVIQNCTSVCILLRFPEEKA